jgi:oligopeptide transport system substrate-binding protein
MTLLLRTAASALALVAGLGLASGDAARAAEMVYRSATMGEPKSLDPHSVSGAWENIVVGDLFMGLATDAADASPIPGAAESWQISDDGLTYTFKIRDHTWSDGTPVTAEDFVYSFRRVLDPKKAAEYASILYPIKNAEAINSGKLASLEELGARAIDAKTLEVKLEDPTGYFIELLTHYTAFGLPKHAIEKHGDEWIKPANLVVNGPFKITEWSPNTRLVAEKNQKFYDAANVKIDKVIYYPDEDRNSVLKRFRAGEIDFADDFASEQIEFLKRELPNETRISPELGVYYYVINQAKKPFDDIRVRRALSYAIEREAITDKILKTGEIPAYGIVPPNAGTYGAGETLSWKGKPYKERVEEAKALLKEAGFGPDNPLKLELSYNTSENHKKIAVAVQSMWKPLGVQAELVNREAKVHYDALKQGQFDAARAAWIADYNDPQTFLSLLETRTGVNNYSRFSNPEFDRLMLEQGQTFRPAKRNQLMRQAERVALDQEAWAPIYFYVSKNLVSAKLEGWVSNAKKTHRARWMALKQ